MILREATTEDIQGMSEVRLSVKENVLNNPALVTEQDYFNYISDYGKGCVTEIVVRLPGLQ